MRKMAVSTRAAAMPWEASGGILFVAFSNQNEAIMPDVASAAKAITKSG